MSESPPSAAVTSTDAETRLTQVQRELEGLNYAISHDLRAPLRALTGFSQALKEEAALQADTTAQHYLQRIEQAAQRLGTMIDGLLALSRLSQADMHVVPVDLSAICTEVNQEMQRLFPAHHPQVQLMPPSKALCDPYLMRIVMRELLNNAWKFTQQQPDPRIAVEATAAQGDLTVCVRDNGVGFDMRYVEKLGVPFQHLQARAELNGVGIGLAKIQRIINRHGGKFRAESVPHEGAAFYFSVRSAE